MWEIPSWAIGVAVIVVAVQLAKTLRALFHTQADRISGHGPVNRDVAQLREGLDEMQRRLGELEERLDFAERLLAQQRGGERLVAGDQG